MDDNIRMFFFFFTLAFYTWKQNINIADNILQWVFYANNFVLGKN